MFLKTFLDNTSKANLQGYYLYWLPGNEMVSVRDKLAQDLLSTMTDQDVVRTRFDSLGRAHQSFLLSLLVRDGYRGTVAQVREGHHGRTIEAYEVESVVRTLLDGGFVSKEAQNNGNGREEVFAIPNELGDAIRSTVAIENRNTLEMLSLERAGRGTTRAEQTESVFERVSQLEPVELRDAALRALREEHGVLRRSRWREPSTKLPDPSGRNRSSLTNGALGAEHAWFGTSGAPDGVFPDEWRGKLERAGLGTTGVLSLKDFGIQLEEDALLIYQELVLDDALARCRILSSDLDKEVFLGTDFVIDLERFVELLRTENLEVTREGKLYRKAEEKIAAAVITARHSQIFETSTVDHLLDVARRLRFFDVEDGRLVPIALRRRGWQKKEFFEKVRLVYEHFVQDHAGTRWSFHQKRLREIFLEQLRRFHPGEWVSTQAFLCAVIARFLLALEDDGVREEFRRRCDDDRHGARDGLSETVKVPFAKLQHDLSHWVIQRMVLLGVLDVGYKDGVLRAFRLADLGKRLFSIPESEDSGAVGRPALVNPDFEVLVFPGMPLEDEANVALSRFADRQDSERVRRYRLTRESVTRGVLCGMTGDEILELLLRFSRADLPENVRFSVREWTDGVELVRRQKVLLLRSVTPEGMDRFVRMLDDKEMPYERLTATAVAVRGSRNEKAIRDLREDFRNEGLFIE